MKSASVKTLLFTTGVVIFILIILLFIAFNDRPNTENNGFVRNIQNNVITELVETTLPEFFNSIVGCDNSHIYIADNQHSVVRTYDHQLLFLNGDSLDLPQYVNHPLIIHVDSSNIAASSEELEKAFYFSKHTLRPQVQTVSVPLINSCVYLSPGSFVARVFDSSHQQNILRKFSNNEAVDDHAVIPDKQYDGIFCSDGMLVTTPLKDKCIYTFYYRNSIICFDSSMNVLYKTNTIDTTAHFKTALSLIPGGRAIASPPHVVNRLCAIGYQNIFIISTLRGDNEKNHTFNENDVVDRYDLSSGKYLNSFYIPRIYGKQIRSFAVMNNTLFALYNGLLVKYVLHYM